MQPRRFLPQLNISGRGLTVIPAGVWRINLDVGRGQEIDLSGVGDSWWEQVELSKLFLPSNALTEIPAEIANLPSLVTLDAHDNMVSGRAAEGGGRMARRPTRIERVISVPNSTFHKHGGVHPDASS